MARSKPTLDQPLLKLSVSDTSALREARAATHCFGNFAGGKTATPSSLAGRIRTQANHQKEGADGDGASFNLLDLLNEGSAP